MNDLTINIKKDDLQEATTSSYDPIPDGFYNTTVYNVEQVAVKNGENAGKPQYSVQLRVSDGQFENRRLFTYIPLYTGKAFWKTQAFFEALGYDMKSGKFSVPTPAELSGKPITARVKIQDGMNGPENNVSGFKEAQAVSSLVDSLGATEVDADETW